MLLAELLGYVDLDRLSQQLLCQVSGELLRRPIEQNDPARFVGHQYCDRESLDRGGAEGSLLVPGVRASSLIHRAAVPEGWGAGAANP